MAHVVLESKLERAGLASRVRVDSSGTGDWHIGEPMDRRAAATLATAGYDPSRHRARQVDEMLFADHDAVLVMDASNAHDVLALADGDGDRGRVLMFRSFDASAAGELDVPDPWYGGQRGFDEVLVIVERTSDALVDALRVAVDADP